MDPDQIQPTNHPQRHRMPLWVRGLVIAAVVGVVIIVTVMVAVGGDHGPGRHQVDESVGTTVPVGPVDRE